MAPNFVWLVAALVCFSSGAAAQVSSGTAFAVAPGLLITNQHVIDGCSFVDVIAANGRHTGSIVDADAQIDLALLRVSGLKGGTVRLRSPRNVRLGESVMVFGFPLAGAPSSGGNVTPGFVSALRGLKDAAGELQITAPIQPESSGGPLMDGSGLVIGVVREKPVALRSATATGDIPQNVNLAISLEVLADFLAKNKIAIRLGAVSAPVAPARVAKSAQRFTYRVECHGRSQQAATSAGTEPHRLPPCTGSDNTTTRTNCFGEFVVPNGGQYVGEWSDDKPNGQGTVTFSNGEKYVGEFRDGKYHGQGTYTFPESEKYVGEFRDGKYHGQGSVTFPNGGKYVGEFEDDKWNGQGTYTFPDGEKYVGEFRDGKYHGQGTLTVPDGEKYVGAWRDGRFNGQGTLTFPDGEKYVGEFKDDKWNGQGTYTLPNGEKYVGEFRDYEYHGQGIKYGADGSILQSGIWRNNVFARGR